MIMIDDEQKMLEFLEVRFFQCHRLDISGLTYLPNIDLHFPPFGWGASKIETATVP